jgi:alkylation response protein AidB-like acyl-CoA dehydrogenase
LIAYGTEEQQQRFLPGILDSKVIWCTGYSGPHCGSDLAALQCKAKLDGDAYVVNGQKIWTSFAMTSNWIILLVRTSTDSPDKHSGITCLLVPMDANGVTVRPINHATRSRRILRIPLALIRHDPPRPGCVNPSAAPGLPYTPELTPIR